MLLDPKDPLFGPRLDQKLREIEASLFRLSTGSTIEAGAINSSHVSSVSADAIPDGGIEPSKLSHLDLGDPLVWPETLTGDKVKLKTLTGDKFEDYTIDNTKIDADVSQSTS